MEEKDYSLYVEEEKRVRDEEKRKMMGEIEKKEKKKEEKDEQMEKKMKKDNVKDEEREEERKKLIIK